MKLVVSSTELLKALITVSKAIPSKAPEAILENYLLYLKGDILEITGSDREIALKTEIQVNSAEEEGKIAVPARQLTDLLKELPDQPITISTENENSFRCSWCNGESMLPYFNPDDYPAMQSAGEGAVSIEVPESVLLDGIANTVYASADDDNRPVMKSVFFDIKPGLATLVASDLSKLICYSTDKVKTPSEASFILDKRHAAVIKSVLDKDDRTITVTFDSKVAEFNLGKTKAITCLLIGKYPDYTSIIPKNNSNVLTIGRTQLLNVVKRIAVCSPKASNVIKFDLKEGCLEVSAQDMGFEIEAHEKTDCDYKGDVLSIGFKSTHIVDIMNNLSCETVTIKFADKRRPVLILPSEKEAAEKRVFGIVMPVMVR